MIKGNKDTLMKAVLLYHETNLLLVRVALEKYIAENESRRIRGQAPAYDEKAFNGLVDIIDKSTKEFNMKFELLGEQ